MQARREPHPDVLGRPQLPDRTAVLQRDDLTAALQAGDVGQVAAAATEAVRAGLSDAALAALVAARLAGALGECNVAAPALWTACDLAALAAAAEPDQRGPAWAAALCAAAELPNSIAASQDPAQAADGATGPTDDGQRATARTLVETACWRAGDLGVAVVTAHKVVELWNLSAAAPLLPALSAWLQAQREQMPTATAHLARQANWRGQLAAIAAQPGDAAKAKVFVEPKFRAHLTDGGVAGALRAVRRGAEVGVPQELLCQSLVLAAAERLWRCDDDRLRETGASERRADLEAVFTLCATVRQLRGRVDGAAWLDLLLYATALVAGHAALDRSADERPALPAPAALHQTWDHGPEIAKVIGHLQGRRAEGAIAVLRAYLLLGLPEQPLVALLRDAVADDWRGRAADQGLAVATLRAGIDEFCALGGHPHRELVLAAAMASVCAPGPAAATALVARRAWQQRQLGLAMPALVAAD